MEKEYDQNDAIKFILNQIDPELETTLGREGIEKILDLELSFLHDKGVIIDSEKEAKSDEPIQIDIDEMAAFIQDGSGFSIDDILEVLDLEEDYLESIGLIDNEDTTWMN